MECFGFATGSSSFGPNFPSCPECILQGYPRNLLDHPAVPSAMCSNLPDASFLHGLLESLAPNELKTLAWYVSGGVLATAVSVGAWRVNQGWNSGLDHMTPSLKHDVQFIDNTAKIGKDPVAAGQVAQSPQKAKTDRGTPRDRTAHRSDTDTRKEQMQVVPSARVNMSVTQGATHTSVQVFHRQLIEVLARLEDTKSRLREVEGERDLLRAEVQLHKNTTVRIQREMADETEKRVQAEMKTEMMEMETSLLKQIRKELSQRTDQVESLERCIREKEQEQHKLFDENVVIPRAVANSRAKAFSEMQRRVLQIDSKLTGPGDSGYLSPERTKPITDELTGMNAAVVLKDRSVRKPFIKRRLSLSPPPTPRVKCDLTRETSDTHIVTRPLLGKEPKQCSRQWASPPRKVQRLQKNIIPKKGAAIFRAYKVSDAEGNLCGTAGRNSIVTKSHQPLSSISKVHKPTSFSENANDFENNEVWATPCVSAVEQKALYADNNGLLYRVTNLLQGYSGGSSQSDNVPLNKHLQNVSQESFSDFETPVGQFVSDSAGSPLDCSAFMSASCVWTTPSASSEAATETPTPTIAETESFSPVLRPQRKEKRRLKGQMIKLQCQTGSSQETVQDAMLLHANKSNHFSRKSPCTFQVRYRPKKSGSEFQDDLSAPSGTGEESADDSDDSWIVIVPTN